MVLSGTFSRLVAPVFRCTENDGGRVLRTARSGSRATLIMSVVELLKPNADNRTTLAVPPGPVLSPD